MLDYIRKRTNSLFSIFLVGAVVVVMAMFGIGGMNEGPISGGVAAVVNGEVITARDFQYALEAQINQFRARFGGQFDERLVYQFGIPQRTLEQMIQMKLLSQQATRLEIIVPDKELADYIRSLPYYQRNGQFDAAAYAKIPNRGLQEKKFREELAFSRFHNYLAGRIELTPAEIKADYQLDNTKVTLEYAKVDFKEIASKKKPSAAQLNEEKKKIDEPRIQTYYDQNIADYTRKAEYQYRQLRVGVPYQANEDQKNKAKAKMEGIKAEVTAQNFNQIATTKSDDEYAKKGGLVGWVKEGELEPALDAALKVLKPTEVSPVVETSFGFFILQLENKKEGAVTPMVNVKDAIATKLATQSYQDTLTTQLREDWEKTTGDTKNLRSKITREGIKIEKTEPFALGQNYIPKIGDAPALLDATFKLTLQNPEPDKLLSYKDDLYYIKLVSVQTPSAEKLAQEPQTTERAIATALQAQLLTDWVSDLQEEASITTKLNFDQQATM